MKLSKTSSIKALLSAGMLLVFCPLLSPAREKPEALPSTITVGGRQFAVIPPDSMLASTETYENGFSSGSFITEDSTVPYYNEQDIESEIAYLEESGDYGDDIYISTEGIKEPEPVNLGGNGRLTIIRKDTGEKATVEYRDKDGAYLEGAGDKIKKLLRCSLDDEEIKIPLKLAELLDAIEDRFGKMGIVLLSGYRSRELNKKTPGAATESLHMLGWAADIRIYGYSSRKLRDFARKLKVGGVGYYPSMGFIHVDIGKVRYWEKLKPKIKKRKKTPKKTKAPPRKK
ncbi:MAG: hypothetical protein COT17_05705 [Elusimicrobia bacterium CG08_land_8_20_14_0_20_51_18]|nr:MAG: hypothetical protein COT17_05705 [Elusimicrobia bacterium CG08_land_8_20_14_0_20_51_18]